jgi:ERCC4-related helicase
MATAFHAATSEVASNDEALTTYGLDSLEEKIEKIIEKKGARNSDKQSAQIVIRKA